MRKNSLTYTPDSELWKMLCAGKNEREAAFTEIYKRYASRVYVYCRKILGDEHEAGDILHDTFLRLVHIADQNHSVENLSGLIFRMARNLCLDLQKRHRRRVIMDDIELISEDIPYEQEELSKLIAASLETLPDNYREALILQTYCCMSYKEISEATAVPLTTVRNRLVRAKLKIKEILEPYFAELFEQ